MTTIAITSPDDHEAGCARCVYSTCKTAFTVYECRRHPPKIGDDYFAHWPNVHPDDWCGHFKLEYPAPAESE